MYLFHIRRTILMKVKCCIVYGPNVTCHSQTKCSSIGSFLQLSLTMLDNKLIYLKLFLKLHKQSFSKSHTFKDLLL